MGRAGEIAGKDEAEQRQLFHSLIDKQYININEAEGNHLKRR